MTFCALAEILFDSSACIWLEYFASRVYSRILQVHMLHDESLKYSGVRVTSWLKYKFLSSCVNVFHYLCFLWLEITQAQNVNDILHTARISTLFYFCISQFQQCPCSPRANPRALAFKKKNGQIPRGGDEEKGQMPGPFYRLLPTLLQIFVNQWIKRSTVQIWLQWYY